MTTEPKSCRMCGETKPRESFRLLSHGYHASLCTECEPIYDRARKRRPPGTVTDTLIKSLREHELYVAALKLVVETELPQAEHRVEQLRSIVANLDRLDSGEAARLVPKKDRTLSADPPPKPLLDLPPATEIRS